MGIWLGAALLALAGCGDDAAQAGSSVDTGSSSSTGTGDTAPPMTTAVDSTGGGSMSADGSGSSGGGSSTGVVGTDSGGSSTGMECFDLDDDGVTDCDGDCDDADPTTYPGAIEICGDGVDNACGMDPDPMATCMGIGTWVSDLTGNDVTGDGTQANPVQTIAAGIANAMTLGGNVPVYVGEGQYAEKVVVVEGIDLLGGHQCSPGACSWDRDPSLYTSAILNTDLEGVVAGDTITRETELDGFDIVGADGNPVGNNRISALFVDRGTPTISNNHIFGGLVSCSGCGSNAVIVFGPSNDPVGVLMTDNVIEAGDSVGGGFANSTGLVLLDFNNRPVVEFVGNTVYGGTGRWTRGVNAFNSATGTVFFDNDIHAGSQFGNDPFGSSFGMLISGEVTVDSNRINAVSALTGSCPSPGFWCGGLESEGATATIVNNVIRGVAGSNRSAAIFLSDGEVPFGEIVINGNTLDGGNSLAVANGISTALACRTNQGVNAMVGRIRNNILDGGSGINRFGFYEDDQAGSRTCEPDVYENNDIWFSPSLASIDNAHRQWLSGGPQNLLPTVADVNMQSYASGNLSVDPQIDATWHLAPGSMCIDAGVATEAPAVDFDGDPRPQGGGVDIGADEAQ